MRVALSSYRSKPHSGGQGVYVRNLSRELVALGHRVEVFSGPPYPELDGGVALTRVPSLDLYHPDHPFRRPALREFRTWIDVLEYGVMCTAGFPEPRTFSHRLARLLRGRLADFDVLHDNQTLGPGLLDLARRGMPVVTTVHHPISADRRVDLAAARGLRRVTLRRWYGFVAMQRRVARRSEHVLTVSRRAADDVATDFGVPRDRLRVVPVGVDVGAFAPGRPDARVPGRIVTIASADVPLKGLPVLVEALARLDGGPPGCPRPELVVVGTPAEQTLEAVGAAGLAGRVRFASGLAERDLAALLASAQLLAVPSLYEGFSLPAVEAMACGTPVVASDVGALPELLGGTGGEPAAGVLVPPGDPQALAAQLGALLAAPQRCAALGATGRARAERTYSWTAVARATAQVYAEVLAARSGVPVRRRPAVAAAGAEGAEAAGAGAAGSGSAGAPEPERPAA